MVRNCGAAVVLIQSSSHTHVPVVSIFFFLVQGSPYDHSAFSHKSLQSPLITHFGHDFLVFS